MNVTALMSAQAIPPLYATLPLGRYAVSIFALPGSRDEGTDVEALSLPVSAIYNNFGQFTKTHDETGAELDTKRIC